MLNIRILIKFLRQFLQNFNFSRKKLPQTAIIGCSRIDSVFSLLGEHLSRCILLHTLYYPDETRRKLSILSCLKLEGSGFFIVIFTSRENPTGHKESWLVSVYGLVSTSLRNLQITFAVFLVVLISSMLCASFIPLLTQVIVAGECVWLGINFTEKPPNHFCSLSSRFAIVNVVRELHSSVYTRNRGWWVCMAWYQLHSETSKPLLQSF